MGSPEGRSHPARHELENRPPRPRTGAIGLLVLAAALVWVVASTFRGREAEQGKRAGTPTPAAGQASQPPSRADVGAPAPEFELTTLDGRPVRLADFRGKPLVLNFFASWCDPCKEEAPVVKAMAAEAAEKGYAVLGVAVQDTREDAARFMQEEGLAFPAAVDLDSKVARAYRVIGPPTTFFIDPEGVIRHVFMGPLTPERVKEGIAKTSRQEVDRG